MLTSLKERNDVAEAFSLITESTFMGVSGATVMEGSAPGPTLGITVGTHGNEPAGLLAFLHFHRLNQQQNLISNGRIIFTLNNIEATRKYLHAATASETRAARYVDRDMNRLPADLQGASYEIRRAAELMPVWNLFDIALDIHSTSQEAPVMLIADSLSDLRYSRGFHASHIVTNIHNVQIGKPVSFFYTGPKGKKSPALGIEVGAHEHPDSMHIAISCIEAFMINAGLRSEKFGSGRNNSPTDGFVYKVTDPLFFKNESYAFTRIFENFEPVKKGTVLAAGDSHPLLMPYTGHVLFAPDTLKPCDVDFEVAFVSEPVHPLKERVSKPRVLISALA